MKGNKHASYLYWMSHIYYELQDSKALKNFFVKLSLGNIVYCKTEDTVFHGISTTSLTFWPKWGNAYGQKGVCLKQIFCFATKKKPCLGNLNCVPNVQNIIYVYGLILFSYSQPRQAPPPFKL